ncbi:MAG: methyltransferase domain-containing protein [Candidatus Latescibacteria bacterium]|nr:methyltransferase domain-containing protein [Candidatus Latescibacterota bacterium]
MVRRRRAGPGDPRVSLGERVVEELARKRRTRVLRHLKGRLLDIGCGDNRLVREHGDGIGVDVVDWGDVDLVVEDTAQLPFEDGSFDSVTFVACLNHIPNREEVLDEARRLLRSDGRLIATMIPPNLSAVWHRIIHPWDPDQHGRELHEGEVWGITNEEMIRMLGRHRFRLVAHERFVFRLNNLFVAVPAD